MIQFYFNTGPNPMKVALCLEETGLPYRPIAVDTRKGEQFAPSFVAINPNAKLPAIVDGDVRVFDSNAILIYLAHKTDRFRGSDSAKAQGEVLSWLMFIATGVGPYCGQALHFRNIAPEPKEYALHRYNFEAERHFGILEKQLGTSRFLAGNDYSIADMAFWGWSRLMPSIFGDEADRLFPCCARLRDEIGSRPAAQRADALKHRYQWKTELDAEARGYLFPHQTKSG